MNLKIYENLKIFDADVGVMWNNENCEKMTYMTPQFSFDFWCVKDVASEKDQIYQLWGILSHLNWAISLIIQRRFLFPVVTPIAENRPNPYYMFFLGFICFILIKCCKMVYYLISNHTSDIFKRLSITIKLNGHTNWRATMYAQGLLM